MVGADVSLETRSAQRHLWGPANLVGHDDAVLHPLSTRGTTRKDKCECAGFCIKNDDDEMSV